MDKKSRPSAGSEPPEATPELTKSIRHRFVEGETTVMPLADVLRSRGQQLAPAAQSDSDRTQISNRSDLLAPRPGAQSPGGASSGQQTQVVPMTAAQSALLSRTEHSASETFVRSDAQRQAARPQARTEQSVRTTLASINREVAASASTQPGLNVTSAQAQRAAPQRPERQASSLDALVAEGVAEAGVVARGPTPRASQPVQQVAGKAQRRVANGCVVVFSCKGGSGATMLSINTAYRAAKGGHTACLVDLDLQMGDVLAGLGLSPKYNIAQASGALADHQPLAKNLFPMHTSGVSVLSQVGALDDMDTITAESMAQLVQAVHQSYDVVVVDGIRDFSDNVLAVLDVADKITVVTVQEVLAIRRARWAFSILRKIGFDPQDITIVVNRYTPSGDISLGSVQSMFEPALVMTIPEDRGPVTQSLNRGIPLLETRGITPVVQGIAEVCANVVYDEIPVQGDENPEVKQSLWRRILKPHGGAP